MLQALKERITKALNGLQHLKATNCESRQHLKPLENLSNVFYQGLKLINHNISNMG